MEGPPPTLNGKSLENFTICSKRGLKLVFLEQQYVFLVEFIPPNWTVPPPSPLTENYSAQNKRKKQKVVFQPL